VTIGNSILGFTKTIPITKKRIVPIFM